MSVYRSLVRLYPRPFRDEFSEDLVRLFEDLERDRGTATAWRITGLDLVVTLPRLHLERTMDTTRSTLALNAAIALLAFAGVASFLTGMYPGAVFLVAALVLGVSQRSALAQAIRVERPGVRARRLRTAAVFGAVFVACYVVYVATIGDSWTARETVLAVVGTLCMVASAVYLMIGLLTPGSARAEVERGTT